MCAGVVWDVGAHGHARARTGRRGDVAWARARAEWLVLGLWELWLSGEQWRVGVECRGA
jgi:hypothetical protein